jgi:hypothetical protein
MRTKTKQALNVQLERINMIKHTKKMPYSLHRDCSKFEWYNFLALGLTGTLKAHVTFIKESLRTFLKLRGFVYTLFYIDCLVGINKMETLINICK